jgi:hypothetical protein
LSGGVAGIGVAEVGVQRPAPVVPARNPASATRSSTVNSGSADTRTVDPLDPAVVIATSQAQQPPIASNADSQ